MRKRRRPPTRIRRLIVLTLLTAVAAYAYWALAVPMGRGPEKAFTVTAGQSSRAIAASLQQQGIIKSRVAFLGLAYVTRKYRQLQSGEYRFSPRLTPAEVLDALYRGRHRAWVMLTIPEGFTLRQIGNAMTRAKLAGADRFASLPAAALDPQFPLPPSGLEGYLFPDTYRVRGEATPAEIAEQMLRRFREVVWNGLFHGQASYEGRRVNDIIILASLVEGEAKLDRERPVIAGVLMNRLQRGQRLECDATVQYLLGVDRKQRLLYKDLELESPYNTYRHAGLPPGPICSPGKASIEAAMRPATVPYLYYVARPDGSHVFSETFADHQAAIARLRSQPGAGQ